MRTTTRALALAPALGLLLVGAPAAHAADGMVQARLSPVPLNDSPASGNAMVTVTGTTLDVQVDARDVVAGQPHAMHIHFGEDARNECPTAADAPEGAEFFATSDGVPAYGPIAVSLTTEGDTSPDSGLAVDRFPTAPDGTIDYARGSITVDEDVAQAIVDGRAAVVIHGNDYNGNGEYDAEAGQSDLDPSLPREATDPAVCGLLTSMPAGGVATGGGSTSAGVDGGLLALGGVALAGGAALAAGTRRRRAADER